VERPKMEFQEHVMIIRMVRYFEIKNLLVVIVADALDFVPNRKRASSKTHLARKKDWIPPRIFRFKMKKSGARLRPRFSPF
jgi:hypothetical protein